MHGFQSLFTYRENNELEYIKKTLQFINLQYAYRIIGWTAGVTARMRDTPHVILIGGIFIYRNLLSSGWDQTHRSG